MGSGFLLAIVLGLWGIVLYPTLAKNRINTNETKSIDRFNKAMRSISDLVPTRSAYIGYWIGEEFAGKGYTPLAVAMAIDHCFQVLKLHRIEIAIRPENSKSLRVVEKLGLRKEGTRPKFLHINGDWRDHLIFAINEDELTESLVSKLKKS